MQCVVQCMIVHEWNVWTFKFIFHLNLFYSSFIFSRLNKCKIQISCPWPCRWNTMIGLTNVICKRCALTSYWQALNHWPRCQFSMNAKCDASLDFSFLMQMLPCEYANANVLTWTQFIQKFPLFSKSRLLSAWNNNIFKSWFVISRKVIFFCFDLRLPKN